MANTFDYIKVTDKNLQVKDAVFDATVVANYGDPGLDEDCHFDILSRFVICKLESSNRTLTSDRYKNMLIVVRRPEKLWINYVGGYSVNAADQKRADNSLNTNVGSANNYSANAIPRMNYPYKLGDKIRVKLIKANPEHQLSANDPFFLSECPLWDDARSSTKYYQSWHTEGLNSNQYIVDNNGESNLRMKTVYPINDDHTVYGMTLNKLQYEAFSLSLFPEKAAQLISLFSNASSFDYYYSANGGYAYSSAFSLPLNFVKYEDMNLEGRDRTVSTNCIPLVVTSPSTFTVPKSRQSGTINYTPTYIQVS